MFKKNNFIVLKIKRNFLSLLFLFFTISILIFSKTNLPAIKSGLSLWANSVIPSLFPFFVATELLIHTNLFYKLGNYFNIFMKPIFNIRGEGALAFIMGIVSGYPVGAKIASNFRKNNICTKNECERLLSFTNNSGPLFIIGTVGILMYRNTMIGILLFITHILSSLSVGFLFRFWKKNEIISEKNVYKQKCNNPQLSAPQISDLGKILTESISSSIHSILIIGRFCCYIFIYYLNIKS